MLFTINYDQFIVNLSFFDYFVNTLVMLFTESRTDATVDDN